MLLPKTILQYVHIKDRLNNCRTQVLIKYQLSVTMNIKSISCREHRLSQ
uniref:Uncharacterized protein n=1 Tax=Anguilla anguilla TaxID=7936 RepID=A0A0E9QV63_ANGAN